MKHLFVPYSLALLAKERGFPQYTGSCLGAWELKDGVEWFYTGSHPVGLLAAPLYQQLVDWFREKHEIHIAICPNQLNKPVLYNYEAFNKISINDGYDLNNYYEALNAALTEAFKLI